MLFSLVAAVFWGAVHALGPGHGKTVVGAYLVGSRGTAKHAVFLGLTVAATHTAGTYLLGFVTLFASRFIVPERLYPALSVVSGVIVVGMGLSLLATRLGVRIWPPGRRAHHDDSDRHRHDHTHHHGPGGLAHSHAVPGAGGQPGTWRGLLALGIYGGMIPCPTAIVVLLLSISLNRIGFGLLLVVAFSAGLALVLTGIGLAIVYAGRALARFSAMRGSSVLGRTLPVLSALVVVLAGLLITLRAAGVDGVPVV